MSNDGGGDDDEMGGSLLHPGSVGDTVATDDSPCDGGNMDARCDGNDESDDSVVETGGAAASCGGGGREYS